MLKSSTRLGNMFLFNSKTIYSVNSVTKLTLMDNSYFASEKINTFYNFHFYNCIRNLSLLSKNLSTRNYEAIGYQDVQPSNFAQSVPRTPEELKESFDHEPSSPPSSKLLKVAIIGAPNSGKSTLTNSLVGWRICSVSKKVHTTQCNAQAVFNHGSTQIVFLDTPGIVTPEEVKKYRLKHSLVADPELSLTQADIIAVLQDISNPYTRNAIHPRILRLLAFFPSIPSILILNKVDLLKNKIQLLTITRKLTDGIVGGTPIHIKVRNPEDEQMLRKRLLDPVDFETEELKPQLKSKFQQRDSSETSKPELTPIRNSSNSSSPQSQELPGYPFEEDTDFDSLTLEDVIKEKTKLTERQVQKVIDGRIGWPAFREVFMISALEGSGVEDVNRYFLKNAKSGQWIFNDETITDQSPQDIALMTVREKCLEVLPNNLPYELRFQLLYWDLSESEVLSILVCAYCQRKSHLKLLVGARGRNAKKIGSEAEQALRNTFRSEIRLRVNFEVDPNIKQSQT